MLLILKHCLCNFQVPLPILYFGGDPLSSNWQLFTKHLLGDRNMRHIVNETWPLPSRIFQSVEIHEEEITFQCDEWSGRISLGGLGALRKLHTQSWMFHREKSLAEATWLGTAGWEGNSRWCQGPETQIIYNCSPKPVWKQLLYSMSPYVFKTSSWDDCSYICPV